MALGIDSAGFELCFANELLPMEGDAFANNLLQEDLDTLASTESASVEILWIKSKKTERSKRLKEYLFEARKFKGSDLFPTIDL
jgi:DNA (cytosine-5)-methyltransferase 1